MSDSTLDLANFSRALFAFDSSKPVSQWIYSVDDAWLHDGFNERGVQKKAAIDVQQFSTWKNGSKSANVPTDDWKGEQGVCKLADLRSCLCKAGGNNHPSTVPIEDIRFGNSLVEFCETYSYGLCLLSFEAFYLNVEHINHRENAVFLDIRHQYAGSNPNCKKAWERREKEAFQPRWCGENTLGWYLYFRFKLAKSGSEVWPRGAMNVEPRHLAIVSSRPQVGGDIANLTLTLVHMAEVNGKSWADCSYFTLPKTRPAGHEPGGVDFRSVQNLFNVSFCNALTYEAKEQGMLSDVLTVWRGNDQGKDRYGHIDDLAWVDQRKLNVAQWRLIDVTPTRIDREDEKVREELRALFRPQIEPVNNKLRTETFWKMLQFLAPGDSQAEHKIIYENERLPDGVGAKQFLPALAPGVFLVLGAASLIKALNKGTCTIDLFATRDGRLQLSIALATEGGLAAFFERLAERGYQATGAGGALCDLLSGMPSLYESVLRVGESERAGHVEKLISDPSGGMDSRVGCRFCDKKIILTVGVLHENPEGVST